MAIVERQQLGLRVRTLRKAEKLSLRKCAEMIGISKDYLVDIEFGRKSPTLDTLVKVAAGFDISLSELLAGVGASYEDAAKPDDGTEPTTRYYASSLP